MRRLFSQSDWLRFAKAANQTGSFRGIGFVWSSGADPRSATRPPVGFGRASGPPAAPSFSRTPRKSKSNSQLQKIGFVWSKHPRGESSSPMNPHESGCAGRPPKSLPFPRNWLRFVNYLRRPFRPMQNRQLHKIGFVWQHWCPAKRGQADGGVGRGPGGPPGVRPPRTYVCATASGAVLFSPCSHSWKRSR